jgi:NAD(P)-dependent dehydrogenase (short-subunit alcohol dehydrogenase family)
MKREAAAELLGKVALVTGGSRGIGLAIARGFLERGAKVVITGRKEEGLQAAVAALQEGGHSAVRALRAHSASEGEVAEAFRQAASAFGPPQIVVNNAATNPTMAPLADMDLLLFDKILETNLRGYLLVAREAVRRMREAGCGGSIINISTVAAERAWAGLGAYGVSKAAVNAMTRVLAAELGAEGIRVNAIAPGLVRTRFSEALWKGEDAERQAALRLPLGRIAEPEDLVGAAVYLASDASRYVTGHTLVVDGGMMVV